MTATASETPRCGQCGFVYTFGTNLLLGTVFERCACGSRPMPRVMPPPKSAPVTPHGWKRGRPHGFPTHRKTP